MHNYRFKLQFLTLHTYVTCLLFPYTSLSFSVINHIFTTRALLSRTTCRFHKTHIRLLVSFLLHLHFLVHLDTYVTCLLFPLHQPLLLGFNHMLINALSAPERHADIISFHTTRLQHKLYFSRFIILTSLALI